MDVTGPEEIPKNPSPTPTYEYKIYQRNLAGNEQLAVEDQVDYPASEVKDNEEVVLTTEVVAGEQVDVVKELSVVEISEINGPEEGEPYTEHEFSAKIYPASNVEPNSIKWIIDGNEIDQGQNLRHRFPGNITEEIQVLLEIGGMEGGQASYSIMIAPLRFEITKPGSIFEEFLVETRGIGSIVAKENEVEAVLDYNGDPNAMITWKVTGAGPPPVTQDGVGLTNPTLIFKGSRIATGRGAPITLMIIASIPETRGQPEQSDQVKITQDDRAQLRQEYEDVTSKGGEANFIPGRKCGGSFHCLRGDDDSHHYDLLNDPNGGDPYDVPYAGKFGIFDSNMGQGKDSVHNEMHNDGFINFMMEINSAFRNPSRNSDVGGNGNSSHLHGWGSDVDKSSICSTGTRNCGPADPGRGRFLRIIDHEPNWSRTNWYRYQAHVHINWR